MWIAGISICLFAVPGIVAVVRSIPASYANIPDEGAHAQDSQAQLAAARAAINRGNRVWCPECGVVESIRQIESAYETTIRFRDGSTTVFNEVTPRTWRLGSRVIVIGGANASNN
jgi:hypothetical protein